jgi:iron complex outermembrane recepter protein
MITTRMKICILAALTLYFALAGASWGRANERNTDFNIPAQSLDTALIAFSRQADVQISVAARTIVGMKTKGVVGIFTPSEALKRLLTETGLEFSAIGDRTFSVALATDAKPTGLPRQAGTETSQAMHLENLSGGPEAKTAMPADQTAGGSGAGAREAVLIEEVVVTGSHIRGATNVGSPLIQIGRDDIERTGYATTQEVVGSLTQNFGGGASEDRNGLDGNLGPSGAFGSGVNLRGLGNDSTLVLLNGRRLAPSGSGAEFVDVSLIPLSAIDRIEVLTDGASALYGSDAVGGVVNFIMLDDYSGAETGVRFGSASGSQNDEVLFSQLLGTDWSDGSILFSYEYHYQDNLASETRDFAADSDLTRFGGSNFDSSRSSPGNILDQFGSAPAFAIPSGQDGTDLQPEDLIPGAVNLENTRTGTDLLPQREQHNVFLTVSHQLSETAGLFADLRYSLREFENRYNADTAGAMLVPSTNPFFVDPFGGSDFILMDYSFTDDLGPQIEEGEAESYGGTVGGTIDLAQTWRLHSYGSYAAWNSLDRFTNVVNFDALSAALADPDPATAFNPFGDGSNTNPATLNSILGFDQHEADSELWMVHAMTDGHLFPLAGGAAKLAVGAEYREETFKAENLGFRSGTDPTQGFFNEGNRSVVAGFAEVHLPFVGDANAKPALRRLEMSAAVRYEDYDDFGSTVDPKIGLVWSPLDNFSIRGTAGTSFKAPLLSQLTERNDLVFLFPFADPSSPTGFTNSIGIFGQQGNLQPEETKTWTAGMEFASPDARGPDIQLNYFDIEIEDRIRVPTNDPFSALIDEAIYAPIITRDPSADEVNRWLNDPRFLCCALPPEEVGAIVDSRLTNVSLTEMRGADLLLAWPISAGPGTLLAELSATYLFDVKVAISQTAPLLEQVSTLLNPPDFRMRSTLSWNGAAFGAALTVNYTDNYVDTDPVQPREVDSWTTIDLHAAYDFGDRFASDFFDGLRVALNVRNLLDEDPPFANIPLGIGYDAMNADPLGRVASLQVTKSW